MERNAGVSVCCYLVAESCCYLNKQLGTHEHTHDHPKGLGELKGYGCKWQVVTALS